MQDADITDELREAAEQFENAEFTDDMPIKSSPELLRRAAQIIENLRDGRGG